MLIIKVGDNENKRWKRSGKKQQQQQQQQQQRQERT